MSSPSPPLRRAPRLHALALVTACALTAALTSSLCGVTPRVYAGEVGEGAASDAALVASLTAPQGDDAAPPPPAPPAEANAPLDASAPTVPDPLPCPAPGYAMQRLRRVVIDPGHGGLNEGAIGHAQTHEKHLTLAVALHLSDRLAACHPELVVTLTRDADVDLGLTERALLANAADADLLISLHFNAAANPDARGHETFWLADTRPPLLRPPALPTLPSQLAVFGSLATLPSRGERRLKAAAEAATFAQRLHAQAPSLLPDSLDRGIKRANFAVLRAADVPAVVVELGFLSHAAEGLTITQPAHQALWVQALLAALAATDAAPAPKAADLAAALPAPSSL